MYREILVEKFLRDTNIALFENGKLAEYRTENADNDFSVGNVFLGRVDNVINGMQASFVDIGTDKKAFLPLFENGGGKIRVKPGDQLPVQIEKEENGSKGAKLTRLIKLTGEYCVLMLYENEIAVSKKIEDTDVRQQLYDAAYSVKPEEGGIIVRTQAASVPAQTLKDEILRLSWKADEIKRKSAVLKAPVILERELNAVDRAVRDLIRDETDTIITDDKPIYESLISDGIEAEFRDSDVPLFDLYGVDKQLEKALARKVWLDCGGYIVIDYTEAMTVIDVNSGKFTGKNDSEETILKINLEAADEVAHQIRLRDIGGIVIVDFIDMSDMKNKSLLIEELKTKTASDTATVFVSGVTDLGLVEITRKRSRKSSVRAMLHPCEHCGETGYVRSHDTIAKEILKKMRRSGTSARYLVTAATSVCAHLTKLGAFSGLEAYISSDPAAKPEDYKIDIASLDALPAKAYRLEELK